MKPHACRRARPSRGFVLIMGLLFLLLSTVMGIVMLKAIGLDERMSANTRDKLRAFTVAQGALQHGEWWLGSGMGGTGGPCSGVVDAESLRVCAAELPAPTRLPWDGRIRYQPPEIAISDEGGLAADGRLNYREAPGLYMSYLGFSSDGSAQLYRVSAYAYGGKPGTVAVVQSTYKVSSGIKDLGGL